MTNLRQYAAGKPCMIRKENVCDGRTDTTVLAHFRMSGISGMGIKGPDLLAAWACANCHAWVDTHKDAYTQLDFAKGVLRTINRLIEEGVVTWTK